MLLILWLNNSQRNKPSSSGLIFTELCSLQKPILVLSPQLTCIVVSLKAHKQWTRFNTFNITKALLLLLLLFLYKYCFQEHTFLKYSRGMEAKANSMSTSSLILTNQAPHSLYFYLRAVID